MPEPENPPPTFFLQLEGGPFPGPLAAMLITMAAFTAALFITLTLSDLPPVAAVGIGEAIGLGGIATLAARRVPEPQALRLGLKGFPPRLIVAVLLLLPVIILISEVDNWVRPLFPPPPAPVEPLAELPPLSDAALFYDTIQTGIVTIGIEPVVKAFLFCGVLLQGLASTLGRRRGATLTSLLYLLVHAPMTDSPAAAIVLLLSALVTAVLICIARLGTGSILAPSLLLAGFAAIHLAVARGGFFSIAGFNAEGAHTPLAVLLASALAVALGARTLLHAAASEPPLAEASPAGGEGNR